MATRKAKTATVERRIHFYRLNAGVDDSGSPIPYDARSTINQIMALPYIEGAGSRYASIDDSTLLCALPGECEGFPSLQFGQTRRSSLPRIERSGLISDLSLAADEGLLETIHVVFFPDHIVGADFNFYGPRISRLGEYLAQKGPDEDKVVSFDPLLRHDVVSQLDNLREIRLFDFAIRPSYIAEVRQGNQALADTFEAAQRVTGDGDQVVEVIFKFDRDQRRFGLDRLIPAVRRLAGSTTIRENALKLQVRGELASSNHVETIDLLKDQLVARGSMLRLSDRGRAIEPTSAFEQIVDAYDDLQDDLRAASAVMIQ